MSEGQGGGSRKSGRRKGRRSRDRIQESEPRRSETSAAGSSQMPRDEEQGATTALPTQIYSEQQQEQTSACGDTQQKRAETPKKDKQRKKHEQKAQQPGSKQDALQPLPNEQPKPASHRSSQEQGTAPTQSPPRSKNLQQQAHRKEQLKQQDQNDVTPPWKPAEETPPGAHGEAIPKTTLETPQQLPPTAHPPGISSGKRQCQSGQSPNSIQQPADPVPAEKVPLRPPRRPSSGGRAGRPIRLRLNFLPVQLPTNDIHHYATNIKRKGMTSRFGYTSSEAAKIIH